MIEVRGFLFALAYHVSSYIDYFSRKVKPMNKPTTALLLGALALILISCGNPTEGTTNDPEGGSENGQEQPIDPERTDDPRVVYQAVIGTWAFEEVNYNRDEVVKAGGESTAQLNQLDQIIELTNAQAKGTTYSFLEDGTLKISAQGQSQSTHYEVLGNGEAIRFNSNPGEPPVDWEVREVSPGAMTLRLNQSVPIDASGNLVTLKMDFDYSKQ